MIYSFLFIKSSNVRRMLLSFSFLCFSVFVCLFAFVVLGLVLRVLHMLDRHRATESYFLPECVYCMFANNISIIFYECKNLHTDWQFVHTNISNIKAAVQLPLNAYVLSLLIAFTMRQLQIEKKDRKILLTWFFSITPLFLVHLLYSTTQDIVFL